MATESMNGNGVSEVENKEVMGREELVREGVRREVKALVRKVADGYNVLRNLMEQNPWLAEEMDAEDKARKRDFDDKLREGLRRANDAPRCRWVYQGGTTCGSPQMRHHIYCYSHRQMMEAQALTLRLPAAEDANAIQLGLMRIQKAVIDDTISMKKAGLLLYSMQLAITNVGRTTFGKAKDDELVTETVDQEEALSEEALSNQRSAFSQNQYQEPFTTAEATEDTEEGKTLPRRNRADTDQTGHLHRNADERGSGRGNIGRIVIKPVLAKDLDLPILGQPQNAPLRDARLPKGPQSLPHHAKTARGGGPSTSELLDADAGVGSVFQTETYAKMGGHGMKPEG
jgi:hypothetical protein